MGQPLSKRQVEALTTMPKVTAALEALARQIATTAQRIADEETPSGGRKPKFSIEKGVRPKGRGYVRVVSDDPDSEFGTYKVQRRRYLGRAVAQFPGAKKRRS